MVSGAVPEFCSVVVRAALATPTRWDPKASDVGVSVTACAVPVPVSPTVWGEPVALSATPRFAVRLPVAPGVKVTDAVHEAPAARVAGLSGQLVVRPKSAALVPE